MKLTEESLHGFYFHTRVAHGDTPAGTTVSKRPLPKVGDFGITEWSWGELSLWFVDDDKFTADQRQAAYESFMVPHPF